MFYHELAHFGRDHTGVIADQQSNTRAKELGLTQAQFHKGMEIEADIGASRDTAIHLMADLERTVGRSNKRAYAESFQRFSYVITAMLGVFDSQRKAFAQYNGAKYLHPMMRHLVFVETTTSVITGVSDELALIWKNTEYHYQVRHKSVSRHAVRILPQR